MRPGRIAPLMLATACLCSAQMIVTDNSGRMVAMLYSGETTEVRTNLVLPTPGWVRTIGLAGTNSSITRSEAVTTWKGSLAIDPTHRIDYTETLRYDGSTAIFAIDYTAAGDLATEGLFLRIDIPWSEFTNGKASYDDRSIALPAIEQPQANLLGGNTASIAAEGSVNALRWTARFDRAFFVNLQDKSNESPRAFTFWVYLLRGPLIPGGTHASAQFSLAVSGVPDTSPARLSFDSTPRYRFFGFGGNYSFQTDSPAAQYTLDNLAVRYARVEMSLDEWEPVNDNESPADTDWTRFEARDRPGSKTHSQLLMAQALAQRGIPFVISVWRLPEWMYADRGQRNPSDGRRKVDPALWNELLESISSYLLWLRDRYGAEPALFSFNETNIGVNVWLTPDEHRDAIKSIGAYLESAGLTTKMLLGDVSAARGTIDFVQPAAADPEALRYVGAVSFHSWGGAAPAQYSAWGDLAERLGLPLLVAELGTDPSAWQGRGFDSFYYGLGEVRMYQEILLYARPQATMYWEFTADYSLLDTQQKPTTRFWLTKHFTDLTPADSEVVTTASGNRSVLISGFHKEGRHTIHIANLGAARQVFVEGAPDGEWRGVRTNERESFAEFAVEPAAGGLLVLDMPERCLVTVTTR